MSPIIALNSVAAIVSLILGYVVIANSKGQRSATSFGYLAITTSLWIGANVFFLISQDTISLRSAYSTGLLVPIAAIYWIYKFYPASAHNILSKIQTIVLCAISLVFSVISISTDLIIKTANGDKEGQLFPIYSILLAVLIVFCIYRLYLVYKHLNGTEKRQSQIILFGFIGFGLTAAIIDLVIPALGYPQVALYGLDSTSALFLVVASTYAITKHGLYNLKIIFTEIAVAALISINIVQVLTSTTYIELLQRGFILALIAILSYFLVKSVQNEVKRREEIEGLAKEKIETLKELEQRNRNLAALQRVSDIILNEKDMHSMTQRLLDEIPRQLEFCLGALVSVIENGNLVAYSFSANDFSNKIYSIVGSDLSKYSYPLKENFNLMHQSLIHQKSIESDNLANFISPPINRSVALGIQRLLGAHYMFAVPLVTDEEMLGVMLFVYKVPKDKVPQKELEIARSIAIDMSLAIQRSNAFQKLKDANEYLSQLDKMKDEFISVASHELNTPLAAIEGYLSMILDEGMGKVDAKAKLYLNRAYESSKRLAELILDLLNVSRIEQGRLKMKFVQTNLADLAESVIHELQIKAENKKIYLKVDADKEKLPLTWCDPDRIREIYVNLVGNGIKFTEKGGITIKITSDGKVLRSEVADTGRGIAEGDLKKLFQKFSQVNRQIDEHQGTGLGLYISKNFVELHKGRIWVESQPNKGSSFIFEIPILQAPPKEIEGAILENPLNAPRITVDNVAAKATSSSSSHQS